MTNKRLTCQQLHVQLIILVHKHMYSSLFLESKPLSHTPSIKTIVMTLIWIKSLNRDYQIYSFGAKHWMKNPDSAKLKLHVYGNVGVVWRWYLMYGFRNAQTIIFFQEVFHQVSVSESNFISRWFPHWRNIAKLW